MSVFNLLNHALNILKDNDLNKINQHMTPLMLCGAAHDSEGKYSNIVSNHINRILPHGYPKIPCILTITFLPSYLETKNIMLNLVNYVLVN